MWTSSSVPGHLQPHGGPTGPGRTVEAGWSPSLTVATTGWAPGDYLLLLRSAQGFERYIPLTVRSPATRGTVVLLNGVTTWQAYNLWGCCDLYEGPGGFAGRSRAVSFDRPYANGYGAGQYTFRELPLVAEAERLRLKLSYLTDVDLQRDPHVLDGAAAVVSMGHDEYWSPEMRGVLTRARDAGTNIAFFGANAIFRRIRFESTSLGPYRLEVNYKRASEDPVSRRDPVHSTADWPVPPAANPESSLLGEQYGCLISPARQASAVVNPSSWLLKGTGVRAGLRLPGLLGPEVDGVQRGFPMPRGVQIVLGTRVSCQGTGPNVADSTYYVAASGARVFDAGTMNWPCAMSARCVGSAVTARVVKAMTDRLLTAYTAGRISSSGS